MLRLWLLLAGAAACGAQSHDGPRDLRLFLLIGQSNMAGRGAIEAEDREVIPKVFVLNQNMSWAPAVDPLHFDKPAIAGVGLGRTFARVLAVTNPLASIGLIPCAFGGSALDQWNRGGELYENTLRRTREAAKSGRLRGILWHQGESDAADEKLANTYGERLQAFIRKLREDVGVAELPVIVGQLGEFLRNRHSDIVNEQLALAPLRIRHTAFVSSAGLTHKGDGVHFDSRSLRELGRRYAYAFLSLDPDWSGPK